jgi:hypothetical protein
MKSQGTINMAGIYLLYLCTIPTLKVAGVITWSWTVVLFPIWGSVIFLILAFILSAYMIG